MKDLEEGIREILNDYQLIKFSTDGSSGTISAGEGLRDDLAHQIAQALRLDKWEIYNVLDDCIKPADKYQRGQLGRLGMIEDFAKALANAKGIIKCEVAK